MFALIAGSGLFAQRGSQAVVTPADRSELGGLMDEAAYKAHTA